MKNSASSSLSSYTASDLYQESVFLQSTLKPSNAPNTWGGNNDDYDDNDNFLKELEQENMMLEKELESLVHYKTSQQKNLTRSQAHSASPEKRGLEKIEEERESYYYSNSDDDHSIHKMKRPSTTTQEAQTGRNTASPGLGSSNLGFENSELGHYKFGGDESEIHQDRARGTLNSSPLRTSHLAKSGSEEALLGAGDRKNSSLTRLSHKEKENSSANRYDQVLSGLSSKRQSFGGTSSASKQLKSSISPPKTDKMDKVTSLEYRLAGANKAIRALENELKSKNDKINELTRLIEKKNRQIDLQQSGSLNGSQSQKSNQVKDAWSTMMRKKEKELEKKIKEQDIMLTENKKYMTRLQELNSKLLSKVKELEDENIFLKKNQEISEKVEAYEEENKKLKEKLRAFEKDKSQLSKQTNDKQTKITRLVDMYDNFERKSEKFIQKNKTLTDTLLSIIKLHSESSNTYK